MYVCVCSAITEKQLKEAISRGAVSMPLLQKELNVASQCGACAKALECYLAQRPLCDVPADARPNHL